jgi:hypothetical protein
MMDEAKIREIARTEIIAVLAARDAEQAARAEEAHKEFLEDMERGRRFAARVATNFERELAGLRAAKEAKTFIGRLRRLLGYIRAPQRTAQV